MTLNHTSGSRDIAEHTRHAERTVTRCRDMGASTEAIVRAALGQVPDATALDILSRLHHEVLERQQRAAHNRPVGSRRNG